MKVHSTELQGVLLIEPDIFGDDRGFFLETWQKERYADIGVDASFVQDNLSYSSAGVLRGLHLQNPGTQAKLVQVLAGEVFDVAVDVRVGSPTFGKWIGARLSGDNKHQIFIPTGFAHGFCVISDTVLFAYKCSAVYSLQNEITIRWDDPSIGIDWPIEVPEISPKDAQGLWLKDIDHARLPSYA
jgi:dTDP-4-dehydrorhamnose 3,5-epimerase